MPSPLIPQPPDLAAVARAARGDPLGVPGLISELVEDHGRWNDLCLNLVASHNVLSPAARALLSSSVADKILSGKLGARDHAGGAWIEAIDTVVVELCKRLFGAQRVEYRAMSGALANGVALFSIMQPGERVMALAPRYGGHRTYREEGYSGILRLQLHDIPYDEEGDAIDMEGLAEAVQHVRPRIIIVGTAELLFPYPLLELKAIADSVDAWMFYDGAHILGLAAGGQFQDPLREGATILTGSTQKTLGGPIGGLILTTSEELGERISHVTSGLISNYHNNRIAALAVTLAEMAAFGKEYAAQVVRNAQALGRSLDREGVPVVARDKGYTTSHIVMVDTTRLPQGEGAFQRLEEARILSTRVPLPHTYPERRGIRLGTPPVTRAGMKEEDMPRIARLIRRALIDQEPPERVAGDVAALVAEFPSVHYCFSAP